MPLADIIALQQQWAGTRWPGHTGARAPSIDDNLFVPLSPALRNQFESASGGELDLLERMGKMRSLRSSSALGVNFFAPWLGRDLAPLARALGVTLTDDKIVFERKFKHGLESTPPNVDIVLDNDQLRPLGIESKFTEPYGKKNKQHATINEKYSVGGRKRWEELGMPKCEMPRVP